MKAIIQLDVPDWQIGQNVTVYFPDSMVKCSTCEAVQAVKPRLMRDWYVCECGASITMQVDGEPFRKSQYCCSCGKPVDWS